MKKKKKLQSSLIKLTIFITLIPLSAIMLITSLNIKNISQKDFMDIANANLDKVLYKIDANDNNYRESVDNIASDQNAINILRDSNSKKELLDTFKSFTTTHKEMTQVYLGTKTGKVFIYPDEEIPSDFDPTKTNWYTEATSIPGKIILTDPYSDNVRKGQIDITYAKAVQDMKTGDFVGVVGLDMPLNTLSYYISQFKIGQNGYAVLIDKKGAVIAAPNPSMIGKTVQQEKWIPNVKGKTVSGNIEVINNVKYLEFSKVNTSTGWTVAAFVPYNELTNKIYIYLGELAAIGLAVILVAIVLAVSFSKKISKPIHNLVEVLNKVGQGDFTGRIKDDKHNNHEVSAISNAINRVIEDMVSILNNVQTTSGKMKEASKSLLSISEEATAVSDEVSKAVQEISGGASDQAASLETSSKITAELGVEVDKSLEHSEKMAEASKVVKNSTVTGNQTIDQLRDIFSKTYGANNDVAAGVKTLEENSNKISAITYTIKEITDQTSLLALNASIEAARAGEAGRGFAVVAEEVRKLADQSSESAAQINNVVNEIKQNIDDLASKIAISIEMNEKTEESVDSSKMAFKEIQNAIEGLEQNSEDMINSLQSIGSKKETVVENISDAATVAQNIAATTEQVSASSEEQTAGLQEVVNSTEKLNELSHKLDELVNKFRI